MTVTTSPGAEAVEHAEKLAPVGPRAGHLLAVDVPAGASGGAKLVKLRVEDLPVGADASVADEAFFRVSFSHILCRHNPLAGLWQANLAKILTYAEESKESTECIASDRGQRMIVRIGEPDDIPALQVIEKKARTGYASLAGFEFVAASPPIAADRLISGTTFVAEVSKALAGFALVQPMDGALYLANISVLPDASNRGVGARLLEGVIAYARASVQIQSDDLADLSEAEASRGVGPSCGELSV